jgi:hypothetical protein
MILISGMPSLQIVIQGADIFRFYNKTTYSGLEIHIANSYANSLLQVMHFTPLIRNMALQHAATSCINELCLLCEMGFLFDMLEKAEGSICQATNLLKTFSNHTQGTTKIGCVYVLLTIYSGTPGTSGRRCSWKFSHNYASGLESLLVGAHHT